MLRAPRINPRPRSLHQNPSGLAVAAVAVVLGAVGTGGYLYYRWLQDLPEERRKAYGTIYAAEWGSFRLLPAGMIEFCFLKRDASSKRSRIIKTVEIPVAPAVAADVAQLIKMVSAEPPGGVISIYDETPRGEAGVPGPLKVYVLSAAQMRGVFEMNPALKASWQAFAERASPLIKEANELMLQDVAEREASESETGPAAAPEPTMPSASALLAAKRGGGQKIARKKKGKK